MQKLMKCLVTISGVIQKREQEIVDLKSKMSEVMALMPQNTAVDGINLPSSGNSSPSLLYSSSVSSNLVSSFLPLPSVSWIRLTCNCSLNGIYRGLHIVGWLILNCVIWEFVERKTLPDCSETLFTWLFSNAYFPRAHFHVACFTLCVLFNICLFCNGINP